MMYSWEKKCYNYIKYSGIWIGLVLNPFHWKLKYQTKAVEFPDCDNLFDNCLYVGPVWIRVIIDDGRW